MMPLTQRRCPARAPHRPEHRTNPSGHAIQPGTAGAPSPKRLPYTGLLEHAIYSTLYMELRVVAFFRIRQIWSCADPGFGERSKSRANRYRDLPSTVNTESLEPASRPAYQIRNYEKRSTPSAADWKLKNCERCTSGVTLLSAANMEFSAAPPSPSAAKMELLAASAAEQELRPPAEAVNSIFAASVADNSIFAALSESRLRVTPYLQR